MNFDIIAPPEPFRALIFDCDGTLADTMPKHAKAWVETYRTLGIEIEETPFLEMGGYSNKLIIDTLNKKFDTEFDVHSTEQEKEERYLEQLHTVQEIRAVADIARAYHGKVPIAVASSGMRRIVQQTLTTVGLLSLFDIMVTADDVVHGKPAPDIFLLASERLGIPPADCIVYEDGDPGLEAARRAGMRAVDIRQLWR